MDIELPNLRPAIESLWPRGTTRAQQKTVLRLIAAAAEERLPLQPLLEAQERDERGKQKWRLRRLNGALSQGDSLPDALEQVVGLLAEEDVLAIRFGYQSGAVAAAVRQRLAAEGLITPRLRVGIGRLIFYLGVLLLVAVPASIFLQVYIIPQFDQIFAEFELPTSAWFDVLRRSFPWVANFELLVAMLMAVGLLVLLSDRAQRYLHRALAGGVFHPLRQWRAAATLEEFGVATAAGRPLPGVISTLARYHYDAHLRHKLLYVRNELEQGAPLWPTLVSTQLLVPAEVEALETADRLGNRAWVLRQIADLRRGLVQRKLERWAAIAMVVLVFAIGAFVLLHALAVILSLTNLIGALA